MLCEITLVKTTWKQQHNANVTRKYVRGTKAPKLVSSAKHHYLVNTTAWVKSLASAFNYTLATTSYPYFPMIKNSSSSRVSRILLTAAISLEPNSFSALDVPQC